LEVERRRARDSPPYLGLEFQPPMLQLAWAQVWGRLRSAYVGKGRTKKACFSLLVKQIGGSEDKKCKHIVDS